MRKSSSQLTKLYMVVITLLILLIPFYLYYTFYVSSERAYLTNRNFRLLTTIGNLVKTTIERFDDILKKESSKAFRFSVEDFKNGITAEALYEEIKKDHNDVKEVVLSSSDFQDGEFGDTFFREDEFEKGTSVEGLCKAISKEFNITVNATTNTIAWLNELLEIPNFHEIFKEKPKYFNFKFKSKEIPRLIEKIQKYKGKEFSDLSKDEQELIPILNRLILEEGYPKQTPNTNTITTESLCASINTASNGNVRLPSNEENSLEWLNKLLKVPNLYSVLYKNKENEIKKINPFAFRTEEFKDDGAKLCEAISDDKPGFFGVVKPKINTIEQLNKLLENPKFCKKFVKKNQKFSKEITQLIEKTEGYQDKQFSDLSKDKQETIRQLNRLILKEGYPELTPEVYRNFDELIRLSNETERYWDKQLSDLSKDELVRLSNETEECRNKKNIFYDMNNINELRKVQRFNRLLLEFTYPIKTPKIEMGVSEAAYNHALNEILKEPGFYDKCKKKDTLPNLSKNIKRLVDDTQGYRDIEFTKLEENQKNSVIQLNRLIIEEIYQKKCPKWNEEVKARLEAIPSFTIVDTPGIKKIAADTKLPISIKNIENMYWLNFNYTPNLGNNSYGVNIKVQTNLGELVGSLVNEKVFDEVMLINQDDGSVIFRYGSLSENFEKFDTLTNQEGKDIKFASVNPPTSLCNINLAGVLYNLYLQPVKFLLFSDEVSKELNTGRWVVCGVRTLRPF